MYPRLTVRSQDDDPIKDEEDSRSYKGDGSTTECLSPVGLQLLKSPVKQGDGSQNRHTLHATSSRFLAKSHPASLTSTPITTTEKAEKNTAEKTDRSNMFLRPRAVVSSRDNDDLIAFQNRRAEKKVQRVKKCYINRPPDKKEKDDHKILGSVPVSTTKAQVTSTAKRKDRSGTEGNVAIIARPTRM